MLPARIVVFAKAPAAGRVKTRLRLEPGLACRLHEAMVSDTLALLEGLGEIELSTDAPTEAWAGHVGARSVQCAGDLGERLLDALGGALREGCERALVLGSDSPTLPRGHVAGLLAAEADVALGPTEDGGYWGIACRRVARAMFAGVEWSSGRTLETTLAAVRRAGLTVELGGLWWDVDEPDDLERLAASPLEIPCVRLARDAAPISQVWKREVSKARPQR